MKTAIKRRHHDISAISMWQSCKIDETLVDFKKVSGKEDHFQTNQIWLISYKVLIRMSATKTSVK